MTISVFPKFFRLSQYLELNHAAHQIKSHKAQTHTENLCSVFWRFYLQKPERKKEFLLKIVTLFRYQFSAHFCFLGELCKTMRTKKTYLIPHQYPVPDIHLFSINGDDKAADSAAGPT